MIKQKHNWLSIKKKSWFPPSQRQFWQTRCSFRRGSHWTGRPQWIYYPEYLSPFALVSLRSGNPVRPSRSLAADESYLQGGTGRSFISTAPFGALSGSVVCRELTGHTRAKLVGELRDEVIIYSVLHRTQYDHRPCVVDYKGSREREGKTHPRTNKLQLDNFYHNWRNDSLTFLSNDWFIGENCVLLSLCEDTKSTHILHLVFRNSTKLFTDVISPVNSGTYTMLFIYVGSVKQISKTWEKEVTHSNCFHCHCWMSGIL